MNFLIADTFTDALQKLTNQEQKAVKQTAFDLQLDPSAPGLRFHKLDRARDERFWSVSVNMDLRLIVHRQEGALLLAYVDHHDDAYRWAQNRKIETHPRTGAAQIIEVVSTTTNVVQQPWTKPAPHQQLSFADFSDEDLLTTGLPQYQLPLIRQATETDLLDRLDHVPGEAAEGLLDLLYAPTRKTSPQAPPVEDPFEHPDAQRRFRILTNREELERALDYPWEKWTVFLHPSQRAIVERRYNGPARVTGSAGTGKTIVALHRAVWLVRQNPAARVLLTTFSKTLARSLTVKFDRLVGNEKALRDRVEIRAIDEMLLRAGREVLGQPNFANETQIAALIAQALSDSGLREYRESFVIGEFNDVIDAWQLRTLEAYLATTRLGRRTPLSARQRSALWPVFEQVRRGLADRKLQTRADVYQRVSEGCTAAFDHIVVDEAQDVSVPQLRFLERLAGGSDGERLFFAGDLGQRIFQVPFSWASLGIEIRGRSRRLKVNYRTSHQIRMQADRLLPNEIEDADGNRDLRAGTVSVFNGPQPQVSLFEDPGDEVEAVAAWVGALIDDGMPAEEIGIFVRSRDQMVRAREAAQEIGEPVTWLTDTEVEGEHSIAIGTMHLAKGLEFRAVVVMACDDEVIPMQARLERLADQGDLDEVYASERHLLYVACTRAREHLWVSGVEPESEFLDDLV